MDITRFAYPNLLWLLLVLLPVIGYYVYRTLQGGATIRISTLDGVRGTPKTFRYYLRHVPFALRCIAIALIVVALARPQSSESHSSSTTEGIDIVLALDISTSMLARDFKPDRFSAAKEISARFINDRPDDRIGLVVFAGESFTQSPLTTDKRSLLNLLQRVQMGIIEDGTAIGNGLATSVNRLRESDAQGKVIILLTDGVNNSGRVAPLTAAEIAANHHIRVYTVGVGTEGTAPSPAIDAWGNITYVPAKVEIDEKMLGQIADLTGGKYFRATDNKSLQAIYDEINRIERSKIEVEDFTRYNELFAGFLLLAIVVLAAEFLLNYILLRRIP